jgi:hypothetical protein
LLIPVLASLIAVPAAHGADADSSPVNATNEVVIQTSRDKGDYRVDTLDSIGPLGTTPILDTPYSISVLPSD